MRSKPRDFTIILSTSLVAILFGLVLSIFPIKLGLSIIGLVMFVIGTIVILRMPERVEPRNALLFAVLLIAFSTKFLWPNFAFIPIQALPTKNPQRAIWALAILFWLYSLATNGELRKRLSYRLSHSGALWVALALFVWRALSIGFSDQPFRSTYIILVEIFDYLPALLFALTWLRDESDLRILGKGIVLTTLVISAITAAEIVLKQNIYVKLLPFDLANDEFTVMAIQEKLRSGVYRAQASFNHPLLLAQFIVTALPVLLLTFRTEPGWAWRTLAGTAIAAVPVVLWASRTRTAIVVAGFVVATAFLINAVHSARRRTGGYRRQLTGGLSFVTGLAIAGALAAVIVVLTIGRTSEESVSSMARVEMLHRAMIGAEKAPVFGIGPGMGGAQAAVYSSRGTGSLDSYWLILLLDSGVLAMLLFLGLLWYGLRRVFTYVLHGHEKPTLATEGLWGLAVVAFGLTTTILGTPHNLPLLYFAIGALVVIQYPSRNELEALPSRIQLTERFKTSLAA